MRLIDADALIDKTDDRYSLHEIGRRERDDIVDALEYAPTIQPELSTNLAEVGTDCISRQSAIDALRKLREEDIEDYGCEIPEGFNQDHLDRATFAIKQLPSVQLDTYWKEQCQSYEQTINKLRESLSTQPEIKQQAINSSDCIDRQAALDALRKMQTYKLFSGDDMLLIDQAGAQTELMLLPSAQPEIVRCKDCKHWIPYDWMFSEVWQSQSINDYPEDEMGCKWCDMSMKANDFCSRADRREVIT